MADVTKTTINFVSPEKLSYYDSKIKQYIKDKDDALQLNINAANTAIANEETRAKAAELTNAQAAEAAKNAADAAQTDVDNLEKYVGTFTASEGVDTVVKYIDAKTANIASDETVNAIDARVKAIEDDYLVAEDKTDLSDAIADEKERAEGVESGLQTEIDDLEKLVGALPEGATAITVIGYVDEKVAAEAELARAAEKANADAIKAISDDYLKEKDKNALSNAINAEKERAEGIEADLEGRLAAVEGDYLKKADKDELAADIKENAEAITVLNGTGEGSVAKQVADAVAGIVDGAPEAYDTLKEISDWIAAHPGSVSAINSAIKANSDAIDALEALVGKLPEGETSEDIVAYIQKLVKAEEDRAKGIENGLDTRLQTVEAKFTGENSVDAKVAAAKEAAIAHADGLNTAMDARVDALEADTHTHANKAELDKFAEGDKSKLDDAVAKAHVHANAAELDKIADGDVEKWNAAEQNAKDHATGLNTAMGARMTQAEADIDAIETSLAAGGATANAIADAKKAGTDAQAYAEALAAKVGEPTADKTVVGMIGDVATSVSDMDTAYKAADEAIKARLDALEAVEHVEMTNAEIDAMFATQA